MSQFGMKDSGARQEFETGARRDLQTGKGRPDLIPTLFIQRLAVVMEKGAEKYGDWNWSKGMPLSRYYASAMRHLMQAFDGDTDEDHLGQCAFNIAAMMWTLNEMVCGRLPHSLDDRPIPTQLIWDEPHPPVQGDAAEHVFRGVEYTEPEGNHTRPTMAEILAHPAPLSTDDRTPPTLAELFKDELFAEDDTVAITPEGLAGLASIEEANQKMRDAGLVECYDGVWRPRTMPEGAEIQTPIFAQEKKGQVIKPKPAVFEPKSPSPMQPPDHEETGDWT